MHEKSASLTGLLSIPSQGCRQLFRTEGANKVKTKELQFGSRYAPPARSAEAKFFFKIQDV